MRSRRTPGLWIILAVLASPLAGTGQEREDAPRDSVWTDAWGQPKNFGLAAAETYMGNFVPWAFNELVASRRELKISQISPRSWWRNLEEGWKWDDNAFQVNFFAHPFQGSIYYNSGRSNGFGYWQSLLFASAGSFNWECCGETHLMSINDWVNTSIGGAAVGEMLYRSGSMVLDNQATGFERVLREAAAFVMSPTRGFTRLVTGNASRVYANPTDPLDHVPEILESKLSLGTRRTYSTRQGRGGELQDDTPAHGYLRFELMSGRISELDRGKPFDYFRLSTQVNFVRGRGLGELAIEANIWRRELGDTETSSTDLVLTQDFSYENNLAFEHGGQGVSLLYVREEQLSERNELTVAAGGTWTILGGVKSELSFIADVEGIRERFREYDFGIGPGARASLEFRRDGQRVLEGSYRMEYLKTLNGSATEGFGSNHFIQIMRVRGVVPYDYKGFSAGADLEMFRRRSDFEVEEIGVVNQSTRIWQIYLTYNPRRDRS